MEKKLGTEIKKEQILDLVVEAQGKSVKQCQKVLAKVLPLQAEKRIERAVMAPTPEGKTKMVVTIDKALEDKLAEIKDLMSHQDPNPVPEKLLEMMADLVIKTLRKNKPKREDSKSLSTLRMKASYKTFTLHTGPVDTRYVFVRHRRHAWYEADSRCQFISPTTGLRCTSTHKLQIEHCLLHVLDGSNEPDNLILLCANHNQFRAYEQGFKSAFNN